MGRVCSSCLSSLLNLAVLAPILVLLLARPGAGASVNKKFLEPQVPISSGHAINIISGLDAGSSFGTTSGVEVSTGVIATSQAQLGSSFRMACIRGMGVVAKYSSGKLTVLTRGDAKVLQYCIAGAYYALPEVAPFGILKPRNPSTSLKCARIFPKFCSLMTGRATPKQKSIAKNTLKAAYGCA